MIAARLPALPTQSPLEPTVAAADSESLDDQPPFPPTEAEHEPHLPAFPGFESRFGRDRGKFRDSGPDSRFWPGIGKSGIPISPGIPDFPGIGDSDSGVLVTGTSVIPAIIDPDFARAGMIGIGRIHPNAVASARGILGSGWAPGAWRALRPWACQPECQWAWASGFLQSLRRAFHDQRSPLARRCPGQPP